MGDNRSMGAQEQSRSVLIVDDDPQVCRMLERILSDAGYETLTAASAEEAHVVLREREVPLMLVDVGMPGESGIELVRHTVRTQPETAALVISGYDDPGIAQVALEWGASGYLTKPVKRADLVIAVMNAFHRRALERAQRDETQRLEQAVAARTAELEQALLRLEVAGGKLAQSRELTLRRLARAVEFRDPATGGHIERMSDYAGILATRCGLDGQTMRVACALHDVGKIAIPDRILLKPGPLTDDERLQMQEHTTIGFELLYDPGSELLKLAAEIALTHHERYDGTGYPNGLAGEEIPMAGRIAAIADAYDALTTDRVYKLPSTPAEACAAMRAERGGQFDPDLLDHFLEVGSDDTQRHAALATSAV